MIVSYESEEGLAHTTDANALPVGVAIGVRKGSMQRCVDCGAPALISDWWPHTRFRNFCS